MKLVQQNVICGTAHWCAFFVHEAQAHSSNFAESHVGNVSLLSKVRKHTQ